MKLEELKGKSVTIELNTKELSMILNKLFELPYKEVSGLVTKIGQEIDAQIRSNEQEETE